MASFKHFLGSLVYCCHGTNCFSTLLIDKFVIPIDKGWEFVKDPNHSGAVMAIFTALIFVATVAYAVIALLQWNAMRGQLTQMIESNSQIRQQRELLRQQLAGTEGATVVLNNKDAGGALFAEPPTLGRRFHISIPLMNDGIVPAQNTKAHLTIALLRFSDTAPIGSLGTCSVGASVISHVEHIYRQCFIEGVQPQTLRAIAENKQVIAIDGDYTYVDGFGNPHKIPTCFRYLSKVAGTPSSQTTGDNRFEECDSFRIMRNAMLKQH
jgi:hypothetical protein